MQAQSAAEYRAAGVLFQSANQERAARGLPALRIDPALNTAARQHAQRMAAEGTLSHQFPGEPALAARVAQQGMAFSMVAENVAEAPSAGHIQTEWMHSPPHRANLLDPRLDSIGLGVVGRDGELYAVEDLAHALRTLTRQQQEQQVAAVLAAQGVAIQAKTAIARSYCGNAPLRAHPLPRLIMNYTTTDLRQLPQLLQARITAGHARAAAVGACGLDNTGGFTAYHMIVLLY
ncbi:MAG: CAP domain-containing protein [Acidobacteriaceae bacterium]